MRQDYHEIEVSLDYVRALVSKTTEERKGKKKREDRGWGERTQLTCGRTLLLYT